MEKNNNFGIGEFFYVCLCTFLIFVMVTWLFGTLQGPIPTKCLVTRLSRLAKGTPSQPRHSIIGAGTVLKLGGHKLRRKAPGNFFLACPPPNLRCAPPPIPGAQRGHTTVENRHGENNTSLKKTTHCWLGDRAVVLPRRSGVAPASGRWAWGWVQTNISHSAAGVRGTPGFFCKF